MIAVDTNILVHAHRADSAFHQVAYQTMRGLAEGRQAWAVPWPCVHEFIAVVTHPRVFVPPTPLEQAFDQIAAWFESPVVVLLAEEADYFTWLAETARKGGITGPRIHDARIAALCLLHGIDELWSADRDFSRFPDLAVRNPLLDA